MNKRLDYLDNLKVALTALVIFHHAGQAYGDGGDWAYTPSNPAEMMPWIWHFFSVNAAFFMGLFFLISGYFVPMSYDKQGGEAFVKKKLMRLGVPFILMAGIISCLSGKVEFAHMWFVESLLLFCLIYALIRRWTKPIDKDCSSAPTLIGLLMVGAVIGIGSYFIRQVSPQDHWIWPFWIPISMEPAHYLQYVMMFVLGILSYRFQWLHKMSNRVGATALSIGTALAIGIYLRNGGTWDHFVGRWFGIYESLLCVFISFGLIWLFREVFNRSNVFMKWCSSQAYGAYIFHLLLMLGLQYLTDSIWIGAFGKFIFIGTVTTIASFCLTWAVKMIPGVKNFTGFVAFGDIRRQI